MHQFCKLVHGCIIQFVWCPQNRTLFEVIKYIFIGRMHVCLAKTCHLHFWQKDKNLLGAFVVTSGWNKYQNRVSTKS